MSNAIVETNYGKVEGQQNRNSFVWRGIPYAQPPLGDLRFRPPHRPDSWDGVKDATQFQPVAPQSTKDLDRKIGRGAYTISEDCLYLNIWSPGADKKRRPVMVWIHGGSFTRGTGMLPIYDGTSFCEKGDIVLVTINYRLGALGFLHLEEFGGKDYATSGNCGILDQVAALQWVQENIEHFGGDPNRVTIFGQSAGAGSVGTLLSVPSAKGLFQQAILQSGALEYIHQLEIAKINAQKVIDSLNLGSDVLSKLKEMPATELVQSVEQIAKKEGVRFFPVIDTVSVPQHPSEALKEGCARNIPIVTGITSDELRLMYVSDPDWDQSFTDDESVIQWFKNRFGPFPEEVVQHYVKYQSQGENIVQKMIKMASDKVFWTSALQFAEMQLEHAAPVWMYQFHWKSPVFGGKLGACHSMELPFVFHTIDDPRARSLTGNSPPAQLADQMHKAWIAFARNGDPNTSEIPDWPVYQLKQRPTLIFDEQTYLEHDPASQTRILWETVS